MPGAISTMPVQSPDLKVEFGSVPQTATAGWHFDGDAILLRVPRLARFRISAGRSVIVELEEGAVARDASAFVLGSAFGAVLHQRGMLVLHASAICRNGRAIAICGPSGAGKSTLAAALCQAGCSFVADDLCAVSLDTERGPVVLPDGRQLKLWRRSIEGLALDSRRGEQVFRPQDKYFVAPDSVAAEPPLLSAIYVLNEGPLEAVLERQSPAETMNILAEESYRPELRQLLGSASQMLAQGVALLRHTSVFRLSRPLGFERLPAVVDKLITHWDGLDR